MFDANARFVIVRDDEGYAVWRLEDLGEASRSSDSPTTNEGTTLRCRAGRN
jgi:hypothetical protein